MASTINRRGTLIIYVIGIFCLLALASTTQMSRANSQAQSSAVKSTYEADSGNITMALTGDSVIIRPLAPFREENFLALRKLILDGDVRFTNAETLFHNYENWPTVMGQGMWMRSDPSIIKDLQWMGVNMVSSANNHAYDFGQDGVLTNIRYLNEAGMVHAGTGSNYAEAIAPAYLETPKGRVALISATSSGELGIRAGDQRRDMKGSPGVNFVRWINEWTVDEEAFNALKRVAGQFKWDQSENTRLEHDYGISKDASASAVSFPDRNVYDRPFTPKNMQFFDDPPARFVLGTSFERHSRVNQDDLQWNVRSVSTARRSADWVMYSIHNHEGGKSDDQPPDHVRVLAHAVIDAGADMVVGHGAHFTRGIEIYKGKPVFYSLGNFVSENEVLSLLPEQMMHFYGLGNENTTADVYEARPSTDSPETMESFIAVTSFENKKLREVKLYPIDLGLGLPRFQSGRPVLAQGQKARNILERVQRLSSPFGTKIEIQGNIGIIQVE
jgi:poly-gamma-glutamate capsule biosynthesis protein CapA/YwtB (metallophosphatase superfamily)